jgi:hypothetical protein
LIDEVKRSPTPTPENDEEYEDREMNYEAKHQAHQRHMGEDLISVLVCKGKSTT